MFNTKRQDEITKDEGVDTGEVQGLDFRSPQS